MGKKKKERKKRGKTRCLFFKRAVELVSGRWRAEEQQQGVGLIANWLVVANKNSITGYPPPVIVENFGPGLFKPPPPLILPLSFLLFRLREPSLSLSLSLFSKRLLTFVRKKYSMLSDTVDRLPTLWPDRETLLRFHHHPPSPSMPLLYSEFHSRSSGWEWMQRGVSAWTSDTILFFSLSLSYTRY